jgi:protein-tyrosine phosphatase
MSQILSFLYLGGKADAKDKDKLKKLNIKYILNCTPPRTLDPENGCPNYYEKEKSFIYKRIPIFDNKGEDIMGHMNTACSFIEESKHYGNILVHCHKGVSRSASFVIGYLMNKNEFTLDEALQHVKSCRSIVQPNTSFMYQLRQYKPQGSESTGDEQTNSSIGPSIGPSVGPFAGPSVNPSVDLSPGPVKESTERVSTGSTEAGPNPPAKVLVSGPMPELEHNETIESGSVAPQDKNRKIDEVDDNNVGNNKRPRISSETVTGADSESCT